MQQAPGLVSPSSGPTQRGAPRRAPSSLGARLEHNEGLFAFLLVLPALLIVIALYVYPLVFSLVVSFFRSDIRHPGVEFRGLQNYIDIFRDPDLVASFGRTIYFTVASLAIEMVVGVTVAVMFNSRFVGRPLARSVILIPWAVPPVVNGIIWNWMVHAKIGILNFALTSVGLLDRYKPWLADGGWALNIIVIADAWKWTPLVVLLVLAGLQSIPDELYEAARMDGAGARKVFFRITLPCVMWPILVTLILRTVEAVRVFDIIYVMTRGGPANATKVTTFYVWEIAFKYHQLGMGSALAYTVTLLIIALAVVYFRALNRRVDF